jgi:hypothetical protein
MAKKAGVGYVNENMAYISNLYDKKLINERKELATREMNNSKRNKLQNVSRSVLANRTSVPKQMIQESTGLGELLDQIEADYRN